jgi:hypothetical protein
MRVIFWNGKPCGLMFYRQSYGKLVHTTQSTHRHISITAARTSGQSESSVDEFHTLCEGLHLWDTLAFGLISNMQNRLIKELNVDLHMTIGNTYLHISIDFRSA